MSKEEHIRSKEPTRQVDSESVPLRCLPEDKTKESYLGSDIDPAQWKTSCLGQQGGIRGILVT